jgi:hypothetical protein
MMKMMTKRRKKNKRRVMTMKASKKMRPKWLRILKKQSKTGR